MTLSFPISIININYPKLNTHNNSAFKVTMVTKPASHTNSCDSVSPSSSLQACMLTFYPEFEADEITENEIIFLLDLSNSMKVHTTQS